MLSLPTLIFAIVASYLIQFAVFIGWGTLIAYAIREPDQSVFGTLLLGLFGVTFALLTIHFFWPINFAVAVTVALPAGFGVYLFVKQIYKLKLLPNWQLILIGLAFFLFICYLSEEKFIHYDTGLYHFQKVLWYNQKPIWPGLALLHTRFGFNVSFFLPVAMLRQIVPYNEALHYSVVSFWILAFCLYLLKRSLKKVEPLRILLVSILIAISIFPFMGPSVWGFSPDPIITILILFIYIETVSSTTMASVSKLKTLTSLLIIITLTVTIKLSAVILLAPIVSLFISKEILHTFLKYLIRSLILLIPFAVLYVLHGYIESGYFSYPAPITIESPEWQLQAHTRLIESQWVTAWARTNGTIPLEESIHGLQWVSVWLNKPMNLFILTSLVISFFISNIILTFKYRSNWFRSYFIFNILVWISLVTWFFIAPDKRFGLPSIIFAVSFSIYLLTLILFKSTEKLQIVNIAILIMIIVPLTLTTYRLHKHHWILSFIPLPKIETATTINLISTPIKGDQCWTTPTPCSPYPPTGIQTKNYHFLFVNRKGYTILESSNKDSY